MGWENTLDWLKSLDWSQLNNVLSAIVAATVIAGIGWAAIKFVWNPLFERLGRRRAQAKLMDKLACGSSVAYVESLFGAAQFITYGDNREQRTYHLPGAWVMIELKDARVIAFSITITKRRMCHNTAGLTFGFLKVKLGKDKFGDHGIGYDGERLWIDAYRRGYLRTYYFGRSGANQRFWLSNNMSGVGVFGATEPGSEVPQHWYDTGLFCEDINAPQRHQLEPGLDATGTTVNTLTVMHPEAPEDEFLARNILGADEAHVLMASTIKPPTGRTWRGTLLYRRYQIKRATAKIFHSDRT